MVKTLVEELRELREELERMSREEFVINKSLDMDKLVDEIEKRRKDRKGVSY